MLFLIAIKEEPVAYNIAAGNTKGAEAMLKNIYLRGKMKKKSYNKRIAQIVEEKSILTSRASTMTTFWNAITGPKFWKASWICAALIFCLRLSGIGLTSIYIISMIRNIADETEGKFPISPVVGGFLLAIVNAVFAVLLSTLVPKFGRKTLSVAGCLGMFLCNVSAGVCLQ